MPQRRDTNAPKPLRHGKWRKLPNGSYVAVWQRGAAGGKPYAFKGLGHLSWADADRECRRLDTIHDGVPGGIATYKTMQDRVAALPFLDQLIEQPLPVLEFWGTAQGDAY